MIKLPLYPYQEEPVDRFLERGSLLVAFEMGMGKTPIAIACAEELLGCGDIHTMLAVVPGGLRYQWAMALAKFTDLPTRELRVRKSVIEVPWQSQAAIIDGTPKQRKAQLEQAVHDRPDYVIISHRNALSDMRWVKRLDPGMITLDEASVIKNFGTKHSLDIKRSLQAPYRLALTGTPVENRPEEAFSIMEWVDPDVLGDFEFFEKSYIQRWPGSEKVKEYKNTGVFNKRLVKGMCRKDRADPDVAPYLPDEDHGEWYVPFGGPEKVVYDYIAAELLLELQALRVTGGFDVNAFYTGQAQLNENTKLGRIMSRVQALDMLLDHPDLLVESAMDYEDGNGGSKYCYGIWQDGVLDSATDSPKLPILITKLTEILEHPQSKVLVFTKYRRMLDYLADAIPFDTVTYHGEMNAQDRAATVARFGSDPNLRVFLSSHAGAYGTDMHMANYLINYDLPASSGRADQINGRHVRASSEFDKVFVRNLLVEGTTNERDLARLEFKRKVARAVVDGKAPRSGAIENDLISLTDFLS
jgi:SNF2 family DNA or RNA helicase